MIRDRGFTYMRAHYFPLWANEDMVDAGEGKTGMIRRTPASSGYKEGIGQSFAHLHVVPVVRGTI